MSFPVHKLIYDTICGDLFGTIESNLIGDIINYLLQIKEQYRPVYGNDIRMKFDIHSNEIEIYGMRPETDDEYALRTKTETSNELELKGQRRALYDQLKSEFEEEDLQL